MNNIIQMLRNNYFFSPNNILLNKSINAINAINAMNVTNAINAINPITMTITQFMKQNKLPFIQMYSLLGIVM